MRITWKLVLIALVPSSMIWGVGMYAATKGEQVLHERIELAATSQIERLGSEIDRVRQMRVTECLAFSQSSFIAKALIESNQEFVSDPNRMQQAEQEDELWRKAVERGVVSSLSETVSNNDASEQIRAWLASLNQQVDYTIFGEIFIANAAGVNVAQTNMTSDYIQSDEIWWQSAMQHGLYMSEVGFDESSGVTSIDLCIRIDDGQGRGIGVLKATYNVDDLYRVLKEQAERLNKNGVSRVKLIAGDQALFDSTPDENKWDVQDVQSTSDSELTSTNHIKDASGQPIMVAMTLIKHDESQLPDWRLLMGYDENKILKPALAIRRHLTWIASLATGIGVLPSLMMAGVLIGRIRQLSVATTRFGAGQTDVRVNLGGNDELTRLGVAFNQMVGSVEENQQLEAEKQALSKSVSSMERVLGVIGHELRTPLAAIRMSSEFMCSQSNVDDASAGMIQSIRDETVRLSDMVNNMLEVARYQSGQSVWNWGVVSVDNVLDNVHRVASALINGKDIQLAYKPSYHGMTMAGDEGAISRLILNLVVNSIKYTSEGFVRVVVDELEDDQGANWLVWRVEDSGVGIEDSVLSKLGQAFVLNSGVIGAEYIQGSGLGLAICKNVAQAHGGTIKVQSEVGVGSTFIAALRSDLKQAVPSDTVAESVGMEVA